MDNTVTLVREEQQWRLCTTGLAWILRSSRSTEDFPMAVDELRNNAMMSHLLDALEDGTDIGHYGRLVFAMVAHHFMDTDEVADWLSKDTSVGPGRSAGAGPAGRGSRLQPTEPRADRGMAAGAGLSDPEQHRRSRRGQRLSRPALPGRRLRTHRRLLRAQSRVSKPGAGRTEVEEELRRLRGVFGVLFGGQGLERRLLDACLELGWRGLGLLFVVVPVVVVFVFLFSSPHSAGRPRGCRRARHPQPRPTDGTTDGRAWRPSDASRE